MDAQLIVVQGKHQGKTIPLRGPVFRIGRGETCHLRPQSAQVSREHAEFAVTGDTVVVRDLGSRNGTLVNGKALTAPCVLKDRDVVMVGPLTFAVSLGGTVNPTEVAAAASAAAQGAPHDTDSWFLAENAPGGSKSGDTVLIPAFTGVVAPDVEDDASDDSYERQGAADSEARDKKPRPADAPTAQRPKEQAGGGADPGADIIRKIMGYRRPQ